MQNLPDNNLFTWSNQKRLNPSLWQVENFLTPETLQAVRNEIRHTPATWHSNYGNRLLSENGDYPTCIEIGAKLIPYLEALLGAPFKLTSARASVDLSGSAFFRHFDGKELLINVQIYLTEVDTHPELGTQFCMNPDINKEALEREQDLYPETGNFPIAEDEYYTIPYLPNYGYINDNRDRKVHKTLRVPPGVVRESLLLNFTHKNPYEVGIESAYYKRIGIML